MIEFPIAKINLGLNIVSKRPDGYHNLETVFYPVPIKDALEVCVMDDGFPSPTDCDLKTTNMPIAGNEQDNLVVRAYNLLKQNYKLPRVHAHLYKNIPTQAGMGGGSSDCASMIKLLNRMFGLGMSGSEMEAAAARLGADCPFFITAAPAYAEGVGEKKCSIMHVHFSKIEFSAKGEVRHLTFDDEKYGPPYEPLMRVFKKFALSPYIVCESAGTQTRDAQAMKRYYYGLDA